MSEVTSDKTEAERLRQQLLRTTVEKEIAKTEAWKKKENPSEKRKILQQLGHELRTLVEKF